MFLWYQIGIRKIKHDKTARNNIKQMEKGTIIFQGTSITDFKAMLSEVVTGVVRKELKDTTQLKNIITEYGNRKDVCKKLQISLSTLHFYTKSGVLKGHKIGGKILYKWNEVDQALKEIQTIKYKHRTK